MFNSRMQSIVIRTQRLNKKLKKAQKAKNTKEISGKEKLSEKESRSQDKKTLG